MGNSQIPNQMNYPPTSKNFVCYVCSSEQPNPFSSCKNHQLCLSCSISSLKLKFSVCCLNDLTKSTTLFLKSKLGLCINCSSIITSNTPNICDCNLCDDCIRTSLSTNEKTCPTCCRSISQLNYIRCKICYKFNKLDNVISHPGCFIFCISCIKHSFINSVFSQQEFQLYCPFCKLSMGSSYFDKFLNKEQYNSLVAEFIQKKIEGQWCSACKNHGLKIIEQGSLETLGNCPNVYCKNFHSN